MGRLAVGRRTGGSPGVPRGRTVLGGRGHPRNRAVTALKGVRSGPPGAPLPVGAGPEAVTRRPARRGTAGTPRSVAPAGPRVRRGPDAPGGDPRVPRRVCPPRRPGVRGLHPAGRDGPFRR